MKNEPSSFYQEDRLIKEQGLEEKIANVVTQPLTELGFRLVRVRLSNLNNQTLQIMAERPDYSLNIDDCETISRYLSPVLDNSPELPEHYHLEISSPGIDRPLVRLSDFKKWKGHMVKIETINLINNRKRFRGIIDNVTTEGFYLIPEDNNTEKQETLFIPFSNYNEGRLIITDSLIRETLRQDKKRTTHVNSSNLEKNE